MDVAFAPVTTMLERKYWGAIAPLAPMHDSYAYVKHIKYNWNANTIVCVLQTAIRYVQLSQVLSMLQIYVQQCKVQVSKLSWKKTFPVNVN